jgi:hypothetical protein
MRGLDRREVRRLAARREEAVNDFLAVLRGEIDGEAFLAEGVAYRLEQAFEIGLGGESMRLMTMRRQSPLRVAASMTRCVTISMPAAALMTTATVSTAGSTASARPSRSG